MCRINIYLLYIYIYILDSISILIIFYKHLSYYKYVQLYTSNMYSYILVIYF